MEEQGTGIILARATELRLKIRNSVNTATSSTVTSHEIQDDRSAKKENGVAGYNGTVSRRTVADVRGEAEAEEDDAAVRLLNICDALECLENQLSSLQDLQCRQRYEKEAALSDIEHSRKILLDKLKEYKGEGLEVIHEASAFAGETVHNHDLMLPPYPSHSPHSPSLDNGYLLHFPSGCKSVSNGLMGVPTNEARKELTESARKHSQTGSRNSRNGLGSVISVAAKSLLTIVGIVSILHLSGFGPNFGGKVSAFKVLGLFQQSAAGENGSHNECPPGRILVMEDGEARCIVKERIEVPFSTVVAKPDVNYGCG